MTANVPEFESGVVEGIQHKYPETCLVFPSHGQTCHSYCSFCFRWAQEATWLDQLKPAFEEKEFFFEQELLMAQASSQIKFDGCIPV